MSGAGAPETGGIDATGTHVVVVAGTWHDTITNGLIAGAQRVLDAAGATHRLVRVPGSFEPAFIRIQFLLRWLLRPDDTGNNNRHTCKNGYQQEEDSEKSVIPVISAHLT